jgi:hypothetical protein
METLRWILRELDDEQAVPAHQGGNYLIIRMIILSGVLAAAWGIAWWWFVRCEQECGEVERDAQGMFQRGELLSAIALIDAVDARCRCARFTTGDASPQYALAKACLERLLTEGQSPEIGRILAHARGPILKELAKQSADVFPEKSKP